jgi:phospholipid/cholesterol/gamma-HCH transport system substrate-binding protein
MSRVVTIAVAVVVGAGAFLLLRGGDDGYVVYAKFNDAGGILHNYDVKVGEIAAGSIKDISLDRQDHVVVKMVLDSGAAPIGVGARARIRPVNLLGEKYVDLDPGDLRHPLPSGSVIPVSRTGVSVELDDALNILDPDTRTAMRILINEAGVAMAGRGADFNRMLVDLPPALDAAKGVVGQVAQENKALRTAIVSGDRVVAAVNSKANDFNDLVQSGADALQSAADRRAQLGQTLQNAPAALRQLRGTLGRLQTASGRLIPAADLLVDAAPSLAGTLQRAPQFTNDAHDTLVAVRQVSPLLRRLGARSAPTLRRLRPAANRLAQFSKDVQPLVDSADRDGGLKAFLSFVAGWSSVTSQKDALGHVFRLHASIDKELVTSALSRYAGIAIKSTPKVAPLAAAPPTAAAPQSETAPAANATQPAPARDRLPDVTNLVNGVTGLLGQAGGGQPAAASGDAGKLLNYLLGG